MTAWIISASVLLAAVILLHLALRGRIHPRLQYALWGLVLLRLLPVSLAGLTPAEDPQYANAGAVYTGNTPLYLALFCQENDLWQSLAVSTQETLAQYNTDEHLQTYGDLYTAAVTELYALYKDEAAA